MKQRGCEKEGGKGRGGGEGRWYMPVCFGQEMHEGEACNEKREVSSNGRNLNVAL